MAMIDAVDTTFAALGALVLLTGLLLKPLRRSLLALPVLAFALGVAVGPVGLGAVDPMAWPEGQRVVKEAARLVLAIGLMTVALRLPPRYLFRNRRPILVLLGVVLPAMWLIGALVVGLLLGVPPVVALLIGAIIAPTDPVIASSLVSGSFAEKHLPERVRHILSAEAGANDGLALALVSLPLLWLAHAPGEALREWALSTLLREVLGGTVLGVVVGLGAARALRWGMGRDTLEKDSFLGYTVSLTLVTLGIGGLLQLDALLAVFVAGIAFDLRTDDRVQHEEEDVQAAVNRFFALPVFALLGAVAPWGSWAELGLAGVGAAVLLFVLRRLPLVFALKGHLRPLRGASDHLLVGWFGPTGVSGLFYAALALERSGETLAWTFGTLAIAVSLVLHGTSAPPLIRRYARHAWP